MKLVLSVLFAAVTLIGFSQEVEGSEAIKNIDQELGLDQELATEDVSTQHVDGNKAIEREQLTSQKVTKKRSKIKMRDVVKKVRQIKKQQKSNSNSSDAMMILLIILAIILPWLAVGIHTGWDTMLTLVSILLWLLFVLPGIIFALLVIFDVIG